MRILIFYLNFTIKILRKTSIIAVRMSGDPNSDQLQVNTLRLGIPMLQSCCTDH
ncbi:hypothetical protein SPPR111872_18510 [Sphingobacterium prati]